MKVTTLPPQEEVDGIVYVRLSERDLTKLQNELARKVRTGSPLVKQAGSLRVIVSVEGP